MTIKKAGKSLKSELCYFYGTNLLKTGKKSPKIFQGDQPKPNFRFTDY
jgi:hypothetical protein